MQRTRLALVGAGYIADVHAEVLKGLNGISIEAVVDLNLPAAQALAKRFEVPVAAVDMDSCLAQTPVDCAHILVPPPLHETVASTWLDKGVSVFVEKPLSVSLDACRNLIEKAEQKNCILGVNQNFIYHPACQQLKHVLDEGDIGQIESVSAVFSMPLRQLDAGQMGHWMFSEVGNILLEQAVHPLSQLEYLIGPLHLEHVKASGRVEIGQGQSFYKEWTCLFSGAEDQSVALQFKVGSQFPCFEIHAVGSDGLAHADMVRNWTSSIKRSRWPDAYDHRLNSIGFGRKIIAQAQKGFREFVLFQTGLGRRRDPFFQSMDTSIKAFHNAFSKRVGVECDGIFGARIVALCEEIARSVEAEKLGSSLPVSKPENADGPCDIAVLGGTGFIGRHLIGQLTDRGRSVRVMARNINNLPPVFHHENVSLIKGNVCSRSDVTRCIKGAKYVINLAHGGGGSSREAIYEALVGSAMNTAQICLQEKVEQLIFISSIAALYLGDGTERITPATPVDQRAEYRNDYAWAKAEAERELLRFHEESGLNIHIQRPGLVVGKGTSPLHSGLGFFNNEQHCIGWNRGHNPLPFVLAEDTASAIVAALGRKDLAGVCDNIVGDVRLNAREYYRHIQDISRRPLKYHPQYPWVIQMSEIVKWAVKRLSGRKVPFPPYRDILSRGLKAQFDCEATKERLNWSPCNDEKAFIDHAIKYAFFPDGDAEGAPL